jgi:hypothetical protein
MVSKPYAALGEGLGQKNRPPEKNCESECARPAGLSGEKAKRRGAACMSSAPNSRAPSSGIFSAIAGVRFQVLVSEASETDLSLQQILPAREPARYGTF